MLKVILINKTGSIDMNYLTYQRLVKLVNLNWLELKRVNFEANILGFSWFPKYKFQLLFSIPSAASLTQAQINKCTSYREDVYMFITNMNLNMHKVFIMVFTLSN